MNSLKADKSFAKSVAHKALSDILGKAGKPSSIKLKIKFGGKEKETKKRRSSRPRTTPEIR